MMVQLLFNVTVALLILNMVGGIVIDTFAQMTDAKNETDELRENQCFTTGLERPTFEKHDLDFEAHVKEADMLRYVHFVGYLQTKDATADTPLEAHARSLVAQGDNAWIPNETCWALENRGRSSVDDSEAAAAGVDPELLDLLAKTNARIDALEGGGG